MHPPGSACQAMMMSLLLPPHTFSFCCLQRCAPQPHPAPQAPGCCACARLLLWGREAAARAARLTGRWGAVPELKPVAVAMASKERSCTSSAYSPPSPACPICRSSGNGCGNGSSQTRGDPRMPTGAGCLGRTVQCLLPAKCVLLASSKKMPCSSWLIGWRRRRSSVTLALPPAGGAGWPGGCARVLPPRVLPAGPQGHAAAAAAAGHGRRHARAQRRRRPRARREARLAMSCGSWSSLPLTSDTSQAG
jgi:hypothetical protein